MSKADVFYSRVTECRENIDDTALIISMDYQKNLPLPVTDVQQEYYKRQLWLHAFDIHNVV